MEVIMNEEVTMSEEQNDQSKQIEFSSNDVEKYDEAQLKAKYGNLMNKSLGGHSAFLQKRLTKGQKYFDSGDYQMAKQKLTPKPTCVVLPTGEAIPTPDSVPQRKTSIIQQKFNSTNAS